MELSELQRLIISGLKICEVDIVDITIIMLNLRTEEQQWQMAEYLETVVDNPPSVATIIAKAQTIAKEIK